MGPSGAGKTTFLSVMMGKVKRSGGSLFINGKESEMSQFKKVIGYVPQEDIMLRELTVRENISYSARIRLPRWSKKDVEVTLLSLLSLFPPPSHTHTQFGPLFSLLSG